MAITYLSSSSFFGINSYLGEVGGNGGLRIDGVVLKLYCFLWVMLTWLVSVTLWI